MGLLLNRIDPRKLIFTGALTTGSGLIFLGRIQSLSAFYGAFTVIAVGTSTCISRAAGSIPVVSIAGSLSFGWFGDRQDKRRITSIGIDLTGISIFGFGFLDRSGAWLLALFLVLFSIGYGGAMPMIPALLREYFGRNHLGSIVGFSQGLAMLGSIAGQPLTKFFRYLRSISSGLDCLCCHKCLRSVKLFIGAEVN